MLLYLLEKLIQNNKLILIFAATRYHVELIEKFLKLNNLQCVSCFGSMEQEYRTANINKFKKKQINIMIVTDLASRGIDIPLLDYVINFQITTSPKSFVHRVGRVARNGKSGIAISIIEYDELPYIADVYRFLGHEIPNNQSKQCIQQFIQNDDNNLINNDNDIEIDSDDNTNNNNNNNKKNGMITIEQTEEEELNLENENSFFKTVTNNSNNNVKNEEIHPSLLFTDKLSFGMVPQQSILPYIESVLDCFRKNDELEKLQEICIKATDAYNRTKTKPTKSGIHLSKQINRDLIHPLFSKNIGRSQLSQFKMLNEISKFKAPSTVFEMGGAANPNYKMMQKQRNKFDKNMYRFDKKISMKLKEKTKKNKKQQKQIAKQKELKREERMNKYRDNEFYIETSNDNNDNINDSNFVDEMLQINNKNNGNELKQFIMELDEDERSALNTRKKLYRYNPNSGKYVTEFMGDRINRYLKEKNESSRNVNNSTHKYGKLYQEWKLKSKREIAINGSIEKEKIMINNNDSNNKFIKNLGLRQHRHIKGSNEYFQKQRAQKRINAIRSDNLNKEKRKKEKIKKFKREKFKKWWTKNKERVKIRKGKRRMRGF